MKVCYMCVRNSRKFQKAPNVDYENKKRDTITRRQDLPWHTPIKRIDSLWYIYMVLQYRT
jgi:hypothetical protein